MVSTIGRCGTPVGSVTEKRQSILVDLYVTLEPSDFVFIDVLAHFATELLDIYVRPVLEKLVNHPVAHTRNGMKIILRLPYGVVG